MTGADLLAIRAALILKQRGVERWLGAQTLKEAMLAHMEMARAEQIIERYKEGEHERHSSEVG